MDLSTIEKKIDSKEYKGLKEVYTVVKVMLLRRYFPLHFARTRGANIFKNVQ